ncbi:hypothetical protein [Lentibacillus cibarius]|uniref:Uncharacterized protein n=1 Tax=Lentibacillus cibarius TaxID=2583219 RepID=A0A5S3QIK8_9BACI|nr:hypothetical protein [Lentibacillus cibarius]TMN21754.1 hypothetical protein FFL34_06245 [Lentibacillus cibarius]
MTKKYHHYNKCGCQKGQYCHKCKPQHPDQGAIVQRVVCSKEVQKSAELLLPAALGPLSETGVNGITPGSLIGGIEQLLGLTGGALVNIRVSPDFTAIQQEATVIKDKVINMGYIPATLDVVVTGGTVTLSIPVRIFFQEHTDCPGARPGDQIIETDPVVEADFYQDLLTTDASGSTVVNLLLFKAIVCSHLTIYRPAIEKNGELCDIDSCSSPDGPVTIKSP